MSRGQGSDRNVGAALAQFEARVVASGTTTKRTRCSMRLRSPVIVVALDDDLFVRFGADKSEWARTDGMAADLVAAAVGNDSDRAIRKDSTSRVANGSLR